MFIRVNVRGLKSVVILFLLALCAALTADQKVVGASVVVRKPVNCQVYAQRPRILVRSSADYKLYWVDICSVADSANGEDFRTVVEEK